MFNHVGSAAPSLKVRDWDSATKLAGIVALLAGGVWSVLVYHQTAKQQASAAEIEAQKPFIGKRLEVYEKLATLASAVAQSDLPSQIRKTKRQEMDQVVNGPLALVAQDKILWRFAIFTIASTTGSVERAHYSLFEKCRREHVGPP